MAFTLHVTISGLCMFVPELVEVDGAEVPRGRMHVLMPATGHEHEPGNPGSTVEEHAVRLMYNSIFAPGGSMPEIRSADLAGRVLELGARAGPGADLRLEARVVNVSTPQRAGVRVNRQMFVENPPPDRVSSRLTLHSGMAMTYEDGVIWDYPEGSIHYVEMARGLRWTLEIDKETLSFTDANGQEVVLTPVKSNGSAEMWIALYHVPRRDLPPAPPPVPPSPEDPTPAHFDAYHHMLRAHGRPKPRFPRNKPLSAVEIRGTSPYTCMVISGLPCPCRPGERCPECDATDARRDDHGADHATGGGGHPAHPGHS